MPLPLLPSLLGFPVPLPALPLRPLPRLLPAFFPAVPCHRMRRPKPLPASLQQTGAAPRLPRFFSSLLIWVLFFLMTCRILAGAHGRLCSRKAQVSEGMPVLSEAPLFFAPYPNACRRTLPLLDPFPVLRCPGSPLVVTRERHHGSLWSAIMAPSFAVTDRRDSIERCRCRAWYRLFESLLVF